MLLLMNVFLVYHSKQVNDLLCSYNLVSCGGLSKSDIISAIQNSFANMCVSRLQILCFVAYAIFMFLNIVNSTYTYFVHCITIINGFDNMIFVCDNFAFGAYICAVWQHS